MPFQWREGRGIQPGSLLDPSGRPHFGFDPNISITWVGSPSDPLTTFVNLGYALNGQNVTRQYNLPANAGAAGGESQMTLVRADHLAALDLYGARKQSSGSWGYYGMVDVLLKGSGHGFDTSACQGPPGPDGNACYGQTRAAGVPNFAGAIRPGELTNGIHHSLALNVGAGAFNLPHLPLGADHVWPAHAADDNASSSYNGDAMYQYYMGSLMAIPLSVNIESLGLRTPQAKNIARALQNYGAYSVDRTEGLAFYLVMDSNAEWIPWFNDPNSGPDMTKISSVLQIVKNSYDPTTGGPPRNGVKLDGGDGTLSAPLAPPFNR